MAYQAINFTSDYSNAHDQITRQISNWLIQNAGKVEPVTISYTAPLSDYGLPGVAIVIYKTIETET